MRRAVPQVSRRRPREVAQLPAAVVTAEVRRLTWLASRLTGRAIAHAVVLGTSRTVCRMMEASNATPAPEGTERCMECARILRAQAAPDVSPSNSTLLNEG